MPELSLVVTEKFTEDNSQSLRIALSRHLKVSDPQKHHRASIDPSSFIQLLGEAEAWLTLATAAKAVFAAFVLEITRKAAGATWEHWKERLKSNKETKPLIEVVQATVETAKSVDGEVNIGFGLNIPDNNFGTTFWVDSRDSVEMTKVLAAFIVRRNEISEMIQAEIEHGREPFGPCIGELQDDGSVFIKWQTSNFEAYGKRMP